MKKIRSKIHACNVGIGYNNYKDEWVVFWKSGYVSCENLNEIIVEGDVT